MISGQNVAVIRNLFLQVTYEIWFELIFGFKEVFCLFIDWMKKDLVQMLLGL